MEFRFRLEDTELTFRLSSPTVVLMTHIVPPAPSRRAAQPRAGPGRGRASSSPSTGREAQMDDVASRAGVGVGTVYRHFPTKEALIEALAVDRFEKVLGRRRARRSSATTRGRRSPTRCGRARSCSPPTARSPRSSASCRGRCRSARSSSATMNETCGELMRRAQDVGRPARRTSCSTTSRCSCAASASATRKPHQLPGRLAPPRRDRDRRPARLDAPQGPLPLLVSGAMSAPRPSPIPTCKRSRGTSPIC